MIDKTKCPKCGSDRVKYQQEETRVVEYDILRVEEGRIVLLADTFIDEWESEAVEGTGQFVCASCAHDWPLDKPREVDYETSPEENEDENEDENEAE